MLSINLLMKYNRHAMLSTFRSLLGVHFLYNRLLHLLCHLLWGLWLHSIVSFPNSPRYVNLFHQFPWVGLLSAEETLSWHYILVQMTDNEWHLYTQNCNHMFGKWKSWQSTQRYHKVTGQNGSGQNGMGQNGTDKMVAIFGIDYNLSEFNSNLVTKSHK